MTKFQAWSLHIAVAVLTVTGAVFAWMKYAMKSDDPFAVANHPWQPYMLDAHVVIAPIAVFALGFVFAIHAWPRYQGRIVARRRSGIASMLMLAPMILSGYLMQVLTGETIVEAMRITHWISSAIFVFGYGLHQALRPNANESAARKSRATIW